MPRTASTHRARRKPPAGMAEEERPFVHEEIVRGSASELAEHYASERPKGEITVVVAPANIAGEQVRAEREPGSER